LGKTIKTQRRYGSLPGKKLKGTYLQRRGGKKKCQMADRAPGRGKRTRGTAKGEKAKTSRGTGGKKKKKTGMRMKKGQGAPHRKKQKPGPKPWDKQGSGAQKKPFPKKGQVTDFTQRFQKRGLSRMEVGGCSKRVYLLHLLPPKKKSRKRRTTNVLKKHRGCQHLPEEIRNPWEGG